MTTFSGQIAAEGPLVDVLIGLAAANVQALRQAGRAVPAPVAIKALIDTGSDVTCVDPQVLAPLVGLGLQRTRVILLNAPATGGMSAASEYATSLTVVHPSGNPRANLVLRNHPVVEQALGPLGYQALIGRDVLERCYLGYNGPGRTFLLAY